MSAIQWRLAWRLFRHEARRGELTIILFAIILSVASVLSLSLFSERLKGALTDKSASFMAADAQLLSDKPIPQDWLDKAGEYDIQVARQTATRSMAFTEEDMSLVDLRAVNGDYPLKGEVSVADKPFGTERVVDDLPQAGEAWLDARLFQKLNLALGDEVNIGDKPLTVTRVLAEIPDAGFSVFNTDPMILMSLDDLAAANITGPGSRVTYRGYFVGDEDQLEAYLDWLRPNLQDDLHYIRTLKNSENAISNSVGNAERYFLLASLLAIILAAVSIAVAAQRYSQRHFDPVAIMKTLGASRPMIRNIYTLQVMFIAILGIAIGVAVGFVIQQIVVSALAEQVDVSLDVWHWRPVIIAVFTGSVCAILFSLYPLMQLFSIPPLRVLRRSMESGLSSRLFQFGTSGGAIFLLMYAYSQDLKISLILFVSGVVLAAGLMAVTYGLIVAGRKLGQGSMGAWQLAWARIRRRAMDNSVQLISFSITIMLLLIVLVMRNDMVEQWRAQLPEGTPNYFMTNITFDEKDAMAQDFAAKNVVIEEFFPVVRGRFVGVNDEIVNNEVTKETDDNREDRGRQGLGREANLTWNTKLQFENKVVAGQWHDNWIAPEGQTPEFVLYPVSVEEQVAENLDINLGDVLTFNVGSVVIKTEVTSLRSVNWQTFQPNFFFVLHPAALDGFAGTYLTSFNLPAERRPELSSLLQPYSSVTLFDVDARLNQVRDIINQVSLAVEFILVLVLVAGSLVLIAQIQASMDERQQELAILRTLGAKGRLIRFSVINEFLIIGGVAGLMAALANELTLFLLQSQVFDMESNLHFEYWIIAPLSGALVVGMLGAIGCWRLLSLNTTALLRRMV